MPALALCALVMISYVPALSNGFVWDDDDYVVNNVTLRNADGLRQMWLQPSAVPQYYPLVYMSYWGEYHVWGLTPGGYHLDNVLLHAANAALLWRTLAALAVPAPWWAAAIFAVHPVHVESVAWITERKNVLSGFFYLTSLLTLLPSFGLLGTRTRQTAPAPSRYVGGTLLYVCALLSKTATCALPVTILILVWWKGMPLTRRVWKRVVPLFVVGLSLSAITIWIETHHVGAEGDQWARPVLERCLLAGRALWFYAGKLLWPHPLTFIYPRWVIDAGAPSSYLFLLAAFGVVVVLYRARTRLSRGPLAAVVFFGVTLAPVLGFFNIYFFLFSFAADHFQYLASIGLIALAVGLGARATARMSPVVRGLAGGVVLVALGVATWTQCAIYKDLDTLWRDTLAKNPDCWLAEHNLANYLRDQKRPAEALPHFEQAVRLRPGYAKAEMNWGIALHDMHRVPEALEHYRRALAYRPAFPEAHVNLGNALYALNELPAAVAEYEEALREPASAGTASASHNGLGAALLRQGQAREAAIHFRSALTLDVNNASARQNLTVALRAQ